MNRVSGYMRQEVDRTTGEVLRELHVTYEDVQAIPCPACGVAGGESCRCHSGCDRTRSMWKQHAERRDAAFDHAAKLNP